VAHQDHRGEGQQAVGTNPNRLALLDVMETDITLTPDECLRKADVCRKRGEASNDPHTKEEYRKLAEKWEAHAAEIENDLA